MLTDLTRQRYEEFSRFVRRRAAKGRWLVLTHDNPDPDAIAAATGLAKMLRRRFKRRVTIAYGGMVGRAENQETLKVLGSRFSQVRHINWKHYRHYALVDTQPGTGNNQLPAQVTPDVVFDHHPIRKASQKVPFVDIRTDYGATATLIAEYLIASEVEFTRREATAFVYAIRTETQDFSREFSRPDKEAFDHLLPKADARALARIQTPRLPLSYFRNLHEALENLQSVSTLVVSHLARVEQPDIVPEIADLMVRLQGKTWSLCTGVYGDRVYLSLRTTNPRADAGRLMRRLLGRRGKGGGHGMIAGGWVQITEARRADPASLQRELATRLAKMLKKNPERLIAMELSPQEGTASV